MSSPEQPTNPLPSEDIGRIGRRLLRLAKDFDGTVKRELPPEIAQAFLDEQHEVAAHRDRAATSGSLDMHLD
ncbi:MAG TPA: hypothetical protein VF401_03390 [Candidatus Saccharimonadales bacterium]